MTSYIYYYGLNPLRICILLPDYIITTIDVNDILFCHHTRIGNVMPV